MPYLRSAGIAAVFAALFAVSPEPAQAFEMNEGDVSCIGYDAANEDCGSIQRGRTLPDGRIALADETYFFMQGEKFAIGTGFIATPINDALCLDPDTVQVEAMPISNPVARKIAVEMKVKMVVAARQGYCVRHRSCGADTLAEYVIGDDVIPGMSTRMRIFRADSPEIDMLQSRLMGVAQLAILRNPVTDDC